MLNLYHLPGPLPCLFNTLRIQGEPNFGEQGIVPCPQNPREFAALGAMPSWDLLGLKRESDSFRHHIAGLMPAVTITNECFLRRHELIAGETFELQFGSDGMVCHIGM
eukprot:1136823-Pelagomonas_calceolata.AAC.5